MCSVQATAMNNAASFLALTAEKPLSSAFPLLDFPFQLWSCCASQSSWNHLSHLQEPPSSCSPSEPLFPFVPHPGFWWGRVWVLQLHPGEPLGLGVTSSKQSSRDIPQLLFLWGLGFMGSHNCLGWKIPLRKSQGHTASCPQVPHPWGF